MKIRLGTRASQLALVQANLIKHALRQVYTELEIELCEIKTLGDDKQETLRAHDSDKKDWIYELELAMLEHNIDMAIHSGKDIPIDIEQGTELLPVLARANPSDAFIGKRNIHTGERISFADLPSGAMVGTASLRRQAQLLRLRPDLNIVEHRGNVPTRIRKLDNSEELLGIVIACAGLERLQMQNLNYFSFSTVDLMPAVNQGTLVMQFRAEDHTVKELLQPLVHPDTLLAFKAERAVAEVLAGDCNSAMSIFGECCGEQLSLAARVMLPDGCECIEVRDTAKRTQAHQLGVAVGQQLIAQGAKRILAISH